MRLLVTGGGTGGHIYPALAIARGFKARHPGAEVLYVGTGRGMEATLVPRAGLPFAAVAAGGLERRLTARSLQALWRTSRGLWQSWRLIRRFSPQVVVGTGGYVCGPVVLAAALQGIPTVIHEQNAFPGLTNRILARFSRRVLLTFPEAARYLPPAAPTVHTGLPVRPEIVTATREEGLKHLGWHADTFHVLVVGGSLGAKSLNLAMLALWRSFAGREDIEVLHVSGQDGYQELLESLRDDGLDVAGIANMRLLPYLHEMHYALAAADLVISRAGASFLAEIMLRGLPAVLVPYPHAAENHQEHNARAMVEGGAAVMILDRDLDGTVLLSTVQGLLADPAGLGRMGAAARGLSQPEALNKILAEIDRLTTAN